MGPAKRERPNLHVDVVSSQDLSTAENGQVGLPRTDRVAILLGHHACDLREVPEIVRDPGCQELLQRHSAELGMLSGELELGGREAQSA